MSLAQKKIINIFKTFIERVFVPQLSKMDASSQQEWNKFSNMISGDQPNISEIQLYVETLPGSQPIFNKFNFQPSIDNKPPFLSKIKRELPQQNTSGGFNPSKTFGGEKARMMFPLKDIDDSPSYNFSKQDPSSGFTTQSVMPTL